MKNHVKIEIRQQDWTPGFAAFAAGSLKATGKAQVVINVGGLLEVVKDKHIEPKELPYVVAECLMHEIIHVLEEWAGVSFSEKKVNSLIKKYQKLKEKEKK
jgi:hypothetical protein